MSANVITTIAIFFILQLIASVWWASHVNTLLTVLQKEMKEVLTELKAMRNSYVTKSDFIAKCTVFEKENKAQWEKIDSLQKT